MTATSASTLARSAWASTAVVLLCGLLVLDADRGGPASSLSRCNLALSRADVPPADVLVIGSSRTGTAVDPVTLAELLGAGRGAERVTVERIALARSPLRVTAGLLENYLAERGEPSVVVFEVSFLTERTVERIETLEPGVQAEDFLLRRDANLLSYRQLLSMPAPTEAGWPSTGMRLHSALRGAVLRTGALAYEFGRRPTAWPGLESCDVETWTREPTWPEDFAFSWGDRSASASEPMSNVDAEDTDTNTGRRLPPSADPIHHLRLDEAHRAAELSLLERVVGSVAHRGPAVILLPLPTVDTRLDPRELAALESRFDGAAEVYDLYAAAEVDRVGSWYDDAHVDSATGQLTTAVLARHLLTGPLEQESTQGSARAPG